MAVTGGQYVGDKTSPGPGAYDTREANKTIISYTFKGRTTAPGILSRYRFGLTNLRGFNYSKICSWSRTVSSTRHFNS